MNFLKKLFNTVTICCFSMLLMSLSCSKSDDDEVVTPLRDFGVQYGTDIANIKIYLEKHKLNPNISDYAADVNKSDLFVETNNIEESLSKLPTTGSIYPKLLSKTVKIDSHNSTEYTIYYLVFNEGSTTEKPCRYDEVLVTYRGTSLEKVSEVDVSATEFDKATLGVKFPLNSLVGGWGEIIPLFGKGIFDEVATGNGPNVYTNYGAGVMFLPSGLGYFNQTRTNIPSYSPLVFSFQLQNFVRIDNDNDGIMTVDELAIDSNGDYADTDLDGRDDFIDFDDDNDGYPTLNEIKKPTPFQGTSLYYPFNPIVDNPLTTDIDESEPKGIPDKSGDFSTPTRVRRHLDKTAKPPYTTY